MPSPGDMSGIEVMCGGSDGVKVATLFSTQKAISAQVLDDFMPTITKWNAVDTRGQITFRVTRACSTTPLSR